MSKDITGIYQLKNKINGHSYVGQSINIYKRWREHRSAAFNQNSSDYNMIIYQAIRKHGLENFDFIILEECLTEQLNEREVYWIAYFN